MPWRVRDLLKRWIGYSLPTDLALSDVVVGTTAKQIVAANARRTKVRFTNNGTDIVALGLDPSVTFSTGIPVPPGQIAEFDWQDDLEEVTRAFWGISATAGNSVHVTETLMTSADENEANP